ncbi:MAG: RDD family protein [Acidimicrobiia bacterium]
MSDDDLNHYEVVGVDANASKDAIREAYRARLDELLGGDSMSDDDRTETARLNAAWQVLSDPYQRERYDRSIGIEPGADDGDDDETDDVDAEGDDVIDVEGSERADGRGRARKPGRQPPGDRVGMFSADPQPAPASWPPGLRPPPPRARLIAMVIDLAVLLAIVLAVQTGGNRIIDNVYKEETDQLDVLDNEIDALENQRDRAEDRADEAEERIDRARRQGDDAALEDAQADRDAAEERADDRQNQIDDKEDEAQDVQSKLVPAQLMLTGVILVLALLYLVPSSVRTGRTLGKHLLGVRVVNVDGSRLGVRSALLHYGAPVLLALLLLPLLGQLVVFIVLIGVLTWPRNPNRQGLHDRLAGTLVVDG